MTFQSLYFQLHLNTREHFFYTWAEDFEKQVPFVLSHYHEIENMLQLAVNDLIPSDFPDRASFLLRHLNLSLCLDHFTVVIKPLYQQMILADLSLVRRSHQRVLSVWDTTCRLQRAMPLKEDAIKGPGTKESLAAVGE